MLLLMVLGIGATAPAQANLSAKPPVLSAPFNTQSVQDLGAVDPIVTGAVSGDFALTNTTRSLIKIDGLLPSCSCTSASVTIYRASGKGTTEIAGSSISREQPVTLQPGQAATVHVTVSLAGELPGSYNKALTIVTDPPNGGSAAAVPTLLVMRFKLLPSVTFSPPVLSFGDVKAGRSSEMTVTALIDHRLAVGIALPTLVSTNPYIIVKKSSKAIAVAASSPTLQQSYTVTISPDAPIGPLSGILAFSSPPELIGSGVTAKDAQWSSAREIVTGMVAGVARALPPIASFGPIEAGRSHTQMVTLVGTQAALSTVRVEPSSTWLSASVGELITTPASNPAASYTRSLTITLSPKTPTGTLSTLLTLAYGNGQKELLPVTAYIDHS